MNNDELKETFKNIVNGSTPEDIHIITERVSERFRKALINKSKPRILWEYIMESKITKYVAAAAVLLIAALVGAEMFGSSGNQQNLIADKQIITTEAPINQARFEPVQNKIEMELKNAEQLFAAGDVDGLTKMLSTGSYEGKVAAANFLAKVGDSTAVEQLNELSRQWQGSKQDNPFKAAIEAINSRTQKKIESVPATTNNAQPLTSDQPVSSASQTEQKTEQTSVAQDGKVDLKLRLTAGESHEMKMTHTQNITQTMNGSEMKMKQVMEIVMSQDVLGVDADGNMDIEMTYKSMKMTVEGPMGSMEFDSANPKPADPNKPDQQMLANMVSAIAGCKFQTKMTPTGKTLEFSGLKEMLARMKEKMPGDPRMDLLDKMFDENQMKETMSNMFGSFPDEPVAVGDAWYDFMSINFIVPIDMDMTYMLKQRKDGIAYIDMTAKMDIGDSSNPIEIDPNNKVSMQMAGTINATSQVDEKTGLTKKCDMTMNLSGVTRMEANPQMPQGRTIPMTMQGSAVMELIK